MDIYIGDNFEVQQGKGYDKSQESGYSDWGGKCMRPTHSSQKAPPPLLAMS